MDLDLTPSTRSHGAQRMITATVLVCEALVVFFAVLVAHQLTPGDRALTWTWGLVTAIALLLNGVTLPLLLKFGAEKARMVSMALFLVVFGGTALAGLAVDSGFAFPAPPAWVVAAIPGLLAILSVGGFVLSYFIAQAVYAKKEF